MTNARWIGVMLKLATVALPLMLVAYTSIAVVNALPAPPLPAARISPTQYVEQVDARTRAARPINSTVDALAGP
jgi:hypothetical protein